ncbi:lipase [Holotrichia oblita]|uniref:Lipase n=2 Tax=Holotrichia oblita TaxID=644536 RepID=A0ACB9T4A0_HOLOL|nr:lipase [Holotrichia oblita]KAI4461554.1 lipase [Holotrichia oblita]
MRTIIVILTICVAGAFSQVSEGDIQYYLWNSRTSGEILSISNYGNVNSDAPVKILIHGWTESINSFWYEGARNNYLSLGYNVICVDWSRHAQLIYTTSVLRLNAISEFIARFVVVLSNTRGISLSNVHLVGHSLGAHLSGFTGKNIQQQSGLTVGRITGLDPAGPSFTYVTSSYRLSENDAVNVDTIITDSYGYGINRSLGKVNFLPNGGSASQPGCYIVVCSHNRACLFFTEGILSNNFVARQCSSYTYYSLGLCRSNPQNVLGENVNFSVTGDFYLDTNSRSPYAQG